MRRAAMAEFDGLAVAFGVTPVGLWVQRRRELLFSFRFSALSVLNGGGGGNRTRVREPSAVGPTCLARSIVFNLPTPEGQDDRSAIPN